MVSYAPMRLLILGAVLCCPAVGEHLLTQHNDVARTGANLHETQLTPTALRERRFGKLFSLCVNGQIYAQPLVVTGVDVAGQGIRDVVYVATMENNVYAFDANGQPESPLWKIHLGPAVPYLEIPQGITTIGDTYNIRQWIGITSTPVIDLEHRRMYVTAKTKPAENTYLYRLFSIDITNGKIVRSTDIRVRQNGREIENFSFTHLQRPGLLLSKGLVYLAFGAHQDPPDQNGWVLAYSADTLEQVHAFCTTPGGDGAGIWQAGNGLAADEQGNLYFSTGNGDFNNKDRFGDSFLKLSPDLRALSWFTPSNYAKLNLLDLDLGSAGPVLIPGTEELVGGGKEGKMFLLNRNDLGGLQRHSFWHTSLHPPLQVFRGTPGWRLTWTSWIPGLWNEGYHHIHGSPVFWRSAQGAYLYLWGEEDHLRAFRYQASHFETRAITSKMEGPEGMPGGILALSADGDHGGILWSAMPLHDDAFIATVQGALRAFDANTLEELWSTEEAEPDDNFSFAKFCPPSVVNGKVYLATFSDRLNVYGLRPAKAAPARVSKKQGRRLHQHKPRAERH